jgi:hypothetical protein
MMPMMADDAVRPTMPMMTITLIVIIGIIGLISLSCVRPSSSASSVSSACRASDRHHRHHRSHQPVVVRRRTTVRRPLPMPGLTPTDPVVAALMHAAEARPCVRRPTQGAVRGWRSTHKALYADGGARPLPTPGLIGVHELRPSRQTEGPAARARTHARLRPDSRTHARRARTRARHRPDSRTHARLSPSRWPDHGLCFPTC